ncbi:hypothetical protein CHS0354_009686 [Potamilus streckersoni]|uniref:Uncharacterized protein n=1 Tax=Potamilus streckersoni TaxID=2493646 RepID=A0AAE0VY90_9BIVA|nr:hypothetical protein CHS0354_009686 [Potamilus streckersoni]
MDITANVISSSFNKTRQFTLMKLYSSETVSFGEQYFGYSTANLLYLANSCETSCGSLVKKRVSPAYDMELKNVKLFRCEDMGAEHYLFVRKEKIDNCFKGMALNSFENDGDEQKTIYASKNVEQNGTPEPPSRSKMGTNKSSENKSQDQKRKNNVDITYARSVTFHEAHEKGDSSFPVLSQRKKPRIRNQDNDSNNSCPILTYFAWTLYYRANVINRCRTPITMTRTCTNYIKTFNVCERFQREGSVSEIKLSLNSNTIQLCELRQNNATKCPVMGKTVKFASMDSLSSEVLTEIKRKVHIKYGDKKRRRLKTNGILASTVACRSRVTDGIIKSTPESSPTVTNGTTKSALVSTPTTKYGILRSAVVSILAIKDKRVVSRWIRTCKKLIGFKKKISLTK